VWAAVDAFGERVGRPIGKTRLPGQLQLSWDEIDDLRNLYAQNFGGIADDTYLANKKRHFLKTSMPYTFTSGVHFDGVQVNLRPEDLEYYISQAKTILLEQHGNG
jgi:hypothetical protein